MKTVLTRDLQAKSDKFRGVDPGKISVVLNFYQKLTILSIFTPIFWASFFDQKNDQKSDQKIDHFLIKNFD